MLAALLLVQLARAATFCTESCKNCVSSIQCSSCHEGSAKDSGIYRICYKCKKGCKRCEDNDLEHHCLECEPGYYMRIKGEDTRVCELCPAGCATCSNYDACDSCAEGFYLDGSRCRKCAAGCAECTSADTCTRCERAWGMQEGICVPCGETACTSCQKGTYQDVNTRKCAACPSACRSCDSATFCTSCQDGYFLNGAGECVSCTTIDGCNLCDSATVCTNCSRLYRLENGRCVKCLDQYSGENVEMCNNNGEPTICTWGWIDPWDKCEKCPDHCDVCHTNGDFAHKHYCQSCFQGYFFSNRACYACPSNCLICSDANTCQRCDVGFVLQNGQCVPCSSVAGCSYCDNECKQCQSGFFFDNGKCTKCNDCQHCNSTTCVSCASGKTPLASQPHCDTCESVFANCVACETTLHKCKTCAAGFTQEGAGCGVCEAVFSNCRACAQDASACRECDDGFTLVGGRCLPCGDAVPGCQTCSTTSLACLACAAPLVPSPDRTRCGDCAATVEHCAVCSQRETACTTCDTRYGLDRGGCRLCAVGMAGCVAENTDGSCAVGFSPLDGFCWDCTREIDGCVACSTTAWACVECGGAALTTLRDGVCVPCEIGNCTRCSPTLYACEECLDGFFAEDGLCSPNCGGELCARCVDNRCTHCKVLHGMRDGVCAPCGEDGVECAPFNGSCAAGFTPIGGWCWECAVYRPHCKTCSTTQDACLLCEDGFGADEAGCAACAAGCVSCLGNATRCDACQLGYALQDGVCVRADTRLCTSVFENVGCEGCLAVSVPVDGVCAVCAAEGCVRCGPDGACLQCADNRLFDAEGRCVAATSEGCSASQTSTCLACRDGMHLDATTQRCAPCPEHCSGCAARGGNVECFGCVGEFVLRDGACVASSGCAAVGHSTCLQCVQPETSINGTCERCGEACLRCAGPTRCAMCSAGFSADADGRCVAAPQCSFSNAQNQCTQCRDGFFMDPTTMQCAECSADCLLCSDTRCLLCQESFILVDGACVHWKKLDVVQQRKRKINFDAVVPRCVYASVTGCLRCSDGFFSGSDMMCHPCAADCVKCSSSTSCIRCADGLRPALNGSCVEADVSYGCEILHPDRTSCIKCTDGFFSTDGFCEECDSSCGTCRNTPGFCLTCAENFTTTASTNGIKTCSHISTIPHCTAVEDMGCVACATGFFLEAALTCSPCAERCLSCLDGSMCSACRPSFILRDGVCKDMSAVPFCVQAQGGVCTQCEDGYDINSNNECAAGISRKLGLILGILLPVLVVLVVAAVIVAGLVYLLTRIHKNRKNTIFQMSRSNVTFIALPNSPIHINKRTVQFSEDGEMLKVCCDSRDLLCVGNGGKAPIKVQLGSLTTDKFLLSIEPNVVILRRGEACEFALTIHPLCTTRLIVPLRIIYVSLKTNKERFVEIQIDAITELSSQLDYDELEEEKMIGEGSFGVVYRGKFRGNVVAIKKMKEATQDDSDQFEEFKKEVQMLDKFRCDFIVHFFGACLIPDKICMVSEFAPFGSLADCIKKLPEPEVKVQHKFLLDAAKGLEYLHNNGILHRDIKPDNFLVFEIENVIEGANAKLTDFGSSRNINLLMTNMTFTKGVGTPNYMAPEVLGQERYKKSADMYAFGITMYEVMKWGEAFPKNEFRFPWLIAEFIARGERPPNDCGISASLYEMIDKCWMVDPHERAEAHDVVSFLSRL